MDESPGDITRLLRRMGEGDREAADLLVPLVYRTLRRVAARYMAGEHAGHPLQPTALVHEAYLRVARNSDLSWQDRQHFFAVAAREMRRVLVEMARMRRAFKRGGADVCHVTLDEVAVGEQEALTDVLVLGDALDRLQQLDPRQRAIVDLRFFGGLSIDEVAQALGVSSRTVKREWTFARAWLLEQLAPDRKPARHG